MEYGYCPLSLVPMRSEADDRAEMVNQILFAEHFQILERKAKWSFVRLAHDSYEAWVDNKQIKLIDKEAYAGVNAAPCHYASDLLELLEGPGKGNVMPVVLGTPFPSYKKGEIRLGEDRYSYSGHTLKPKKSKKRVVEFALMYLNAPYLWGGRSPLGIDCSGLTQIVYRMAGMPLFRDASEQAKQGEVLSFIEEAEAGDLAFFDDSDGKITHVGIVLDNNYIIHASGRVRLDRLDQSGIFNGEKGDHTHKLRVIKKVF